MNVTIRRARLAVPPDYARAAPRLGPTIARVIISVAITSAAAILVFAARDDTAAQWFFSLGIIAGIFLVIFFSTQLHAIIRWPRRMRISTDQGLRFHSGSTTAWFMVALILLAIAIGVTNTVITFIPSTINTDGIRTDRLAASLLILAAVALPGQLRTAHTDRHITLTPHGISGYASDNAFLGTSTPFTAPWQDITGVHLTTRHRRQLLRITTTHTDHELARTDLDADPRTLAEIIEFFRTTPRKRNHLNTPATALTLIADTTPTLPPDA